MNAMTKMKLADIEERYYDPENSTSDDAVVTWVDHALLRALREAFDRIEKLEEQLDRLEEKSI